MQPTLTRAFLASPQWGRLSPLARSVLNGVLTLVIGRNGDWYVDATPKELADWFGNELNATSAAMFAVIRELEEAGWLHKDRRGIGHRYVLARSILTR